MMAEMIQIGEPAVDVAIRRSGRARRMSLRISGLDGRVSLTLPKSAKMHEAQSFLQEQEGWIRSHLKAQPSTIPLRPDAMLPVEGVERKLVETATRVIKLHPHWIELPAAGQNHGTRLRGFLKTLARDRLVAASERYAGQLGASFQKVTLRDTRSRWGSCSSTGNLMYSWRLIMAPREVLDYVAAHEVAHLKELNHSPSFWSLVEYLMPDYKSHKSWLRHNGHSLHRYQF